MDSTSKYTNKMWHMVIDSDFTSASYPSFVPTTSTFTDRRVFDASFSSSGQKNPNWKWQIRHGYNATTSFVASGCSDDPSPWVHCHLDGIQMYAPTGVIVQVVSGELSGYPHIHAPPEHASLDSSFASRVENRCTVKFLNRAQDILSSIEAGQDLGEYKETIHSIHKPLSSLKSGMINYLEKLRKLKRSSKNPASLRKILTDTYLEFHFGWQPLADDVAKLIADAGRYRFPQYPVSASAGDIYQADEGQFQRTAGSFPGALEWSERTTHEFSVRRKGVIRSNAANGQIGRAQALRLTPENWLPTAWDLLPYSWIADYFVNIGDILQGLSFISSNLIWGSRTARIKTKIHSSDVYYRPAIFGDGYPYVWVTQNFSSGGGSYDGWRTSLTRSSFSGGDLVPSLEFSIPGSKYPFLNIGAILSQRATSIVPFFKLTKNK
jgi:hypothetical protein